MKRKKRRHHLHPTIDRFEAEIDDHQNHLIPRQDLSSCLNEDEEPHIDRERRGNQIEVIDVDVKTGIKGGEE